MSTPTTPTIAIPAAIYARVSTLKQGEDWHVSLDVQARECLTFAEHNGYSVDPHCIVKEPYTGTTLDRPAFEHLLADMVRRGIRHLIMDKPDRVTREGQVTAAYFIRRLQEIGVTLHLALSNFTVHDEITISVFLNYAFAAKLDNDQRVANVQRTRREAARSLGRYVKGNRAPYGWRIEAAQTDHHGRAITFRLVHDPETYPVLLRILRERQAGQSYRRIASGLTAGGVPTSATRAGLRNATPGKPWHQSSVKTIVRDPINAGIVTAFRSRTVAAPPDARHAHRWYRQVPVPLDEQILLPSSLVVDPPLTVEEYRWLLGREAYALRSDGSERVVPQGGSKGGPRGHPRAAGLAVGHGGLFRHTRCGGTLRVNYAAPGKVYTYYACQRHADVPERCPGFTVKAEVLDQLVWNAVVRDVLLVPGKLEELAEQQRQADMAGTDPNSELRRLQGLLSEAFADQHSLLDSVTHARSDYVRRLAENRLAELEPRIAQMQAAVMDAQRRSANEAQRQAVLADVQTQVGRYAFVVHLAHLLPVELRVPLQRRVLRALGFSATVDRATGGRLVVDVELRLAAGQAGLWFMMDGLPAGEAAPQDASPVTGAQLQAIFQAYAQYLPEMRAEVGVPGGAGGASLGVDDADVGTVRFVTTTSSPCP